MKPLGTDRSDAAEVRRETEHPAGRPTNRVQELEETVASLERERALLQGEVRALRVALAVRGKEHSQLSWQLAEVIDANKRLETEVESREVKR